MGRIRLLGGVFSPLLSVYTYRVVVAFSVILFANYFVYILLYYIGGRQYRQILEFYSPIVSVVVETVAPVRSFAVDPAKSIISVGWVTIVAFFVFGVFLSIVEFVQKKESSYRSIKVFFDDHDISLVRMIVYSVLVMASSGFFLYLHFGLGDEYFIFMIAGSFFLYLMLLSYSLGLVALLLSVLRNADGSSNQNSSNHQNSSKRTVQTGGKDLRCL